MTNELLYSAIATILDELKEIFVDEIWHVGGDEPHYECWDANTNISTFKRNQGNWTDDQLYTYFSHRYAGLVAKRKFDMYHVCCF